MKKLGMIFLVLLICLSSGAKPRKCSGCKWCSKSIHKPISKKRHVQEDCSTCRWCIKKKQRQEAKSKRQARYIEQKVKQEQDQNAQKGIDPDLLAQELILAIKTHSPLEKLEKLIDQGANIDWKDKEGRTPLHWAAILAQPYTIGLLLIHNADIEARDYRGNTPLHLVVKYRPYPSRRKEVIQHLIFEGASIYERNGMGLNVLENAVDMGIRRFTLLTSLQPSLVIGQITF